MSIHQFNASWVCDEDRILLRFNTVDQSEYRIALTRRVLEILFSTGESILQAKLESCYSKNTTPVVHEFQNSMVAQRSDFQSTFKPGQTFPLGDSPILVVAIRVNDGSQDSVSIDFQLVTQQNLNIKIPQANFRALIILLKRLQAQANWCLDDVKTPINSAAGTSQSNRLH